MATKFVLLAALFAASVAFASATTYTTVVTTTVTEGRESEQSCQQEIQQIDPNRCQQYLEQGQGGQGQFLRSVVASHKLGRPDQPSVQECCNEIHQVSPQCRCQAIEYAVRQLQQQQQQPGSEQQEQPLRRAEQLPQLCQFGSPRQCSFRAVFV